MAALIPALIKLLLSRRGGGGGGRPSAPPKSPEQKDDEYWAAKNLGSQVELLKMPQIGGGKTAAEYAEEYRKAAGL